VLIVVRTSLIRILFAAVLALLILVLVILLNDIICSIDGADVFLTESVLLLIVSILLIFATLMAYVCEHICC